MLSTTAKLLSCRPVTEQHAATHRKTLKDNDCQHLVLPPATHCSTLQHTATHCNTMQHNATQCNTIVLPPGPSNKLWHTAINCNTLQHKDCQTPVLPPGYSATRCNTLEHAATHQTADIHSYPPVTDSLKCVWNGAFIIVIRTWLIAARILSCGKNIYMTFWNMWRIACIR